MKKILFLSLSVMLNLHVSAEPRAGIITGQVIDDFGMTMPGAQVLVRSTEDGAVVHRKLTDAEGHFAIEAPKDQSYELVVDMVGMHPQKKEIKIESDTLLLPTFIMTSD